MSIDLTHTPFHTPIKWIGKSSYRNYTYPAWVLDGPFDFVEQGKALVGDIITWG